MRQNISTGASTFCCGPDTNLVLWLKAPYLLARPFKTAYGDGSSHDERRAELDICACVPRSAATLGGAELCRSDAAVFVKGRHRAEIQCKAGEQPNGKVPVAVKATKAAKSAQRPAKIPQIQALPPNAFLPARQHSMPGFSMRSCARCNSVREKAEGRASGPGLLACSLESKPQAGGILGSTSVLCGRQTAQPLLDQ